MAVSAQDQKVQNRPYTDLRPFHFGVIVGAHLQDIEFNNVGLTSFVNEDGTVSEGLVTTDQDKWDMGFQVGVLGEARISNHFAFRLAPTMYFGTRHITFRNFMDLDANGEPRTEQQDLKSVYVAADMNLIYSGMRWNNHRPYIMAGLTPMLNLSGRGNDYLKLKGHDFFVSVGVGCDFYLPFFKLRPELKFMYSLTNSLDTDHSKGLEDRSMRPYALSVDKATTKMICLSFYFE